MLSDFLTISNIHIPYSKSHIPFQSMNSIIDKGGKFVLVMGKIETLK